MTLPLYPFCSPWSLYTDITVNTCAISISSIFVSPWSSSGISLGSMLFSAENFFGNFFSELQCRHIPLTRIIDGMRSLHTLQPLYSILSILFQKFCKTQCSSSLIMLAVFDPEFVPELLFSLWILS